MIAHAQPRPPQNPAAPSGLCHGRSRVPASPVYAPSNQRETAMHLLIALMLADQAQQAPPPPAEPAPVVSLAIAYGVPLEEPPSTVTVLSSDPTVPPIFRMGHQGAAAAVPPFVEGNDSSLGARASGARPYSPRVPRTGHARAFSARRRCDPWLPWSCPCSISWRGNSSRRTGAQSKAREEVKKALKEYHDALAAERKP